MSFQKAANFTANCLKQFTFIFTLPIAMHFPARSFAIYYRVEHSSLVLLFIFVGARRFSRRVLAPLCVSGLGWRWFSPPPFHAATVPVASASGLLAGRIKAFFS